jgi:hypothetical protein
MEIEQALCRFDRSLMSEFSDRTVRALEHHRSIRLVMPIFLKIMSANVDKELDKDRLVIEVGATTCGGGGTAADVDSSALFERTKSMDRAFIRRLSGLPVNLDLQYAQIRPVRIRRIEHLLEFVCRVCLHWQPSAGLAAAVRLCYAPGELQNVLVELLHLYGLETGFICEGARLRGPARLVGQLLSERVVRAMQSVEGEVAREIGTRLYRPSGVGQCSPNTADAEHGAGMSLRDSTA